MQLARRERGHGWARAGARGIRGHPGETPRDTAINTHITNQHISSTHRAGNTRSGPKTVRRAKNGYTNGRTKDGEALTMGQHEPWDAHNTD